MKNDQASHANSRHEHLTLLGHLNLPVLRRDVGPGYASRYARHGLATGRAETNLVALDGLKLFTTIGTVAHTILLIISIAYFGP